MDATQVAELIEKTKSDALNRKRDAARELRIILLKTDKPCEADRTRLLELCGVLGIHPEQLTSLLEFLQKLDQCFLIISEHPQRLDELSRARKEFNDLDAWYESERVKLWNEAEDRRKPLGKNLSRATGRHQECVQATSARPVLLNQFREAFGVDYAEVFSPS